MPLAELDSGDLPIGVRLPRFWCCVVECLLIQTLLARTRFMTINISLTPEAESKLRQRAAVLGQDLVTVASDLLEQAITRPSLDELLAPARKQVAESGMADSQIDGLFRDVLKEVRNEKKAQPR